MVEVDARWEELGERYRASLAIKRAGIEVAWHALVRHGRDPARLENLQRIVHRIAGSAPSYGYAEIGQLASEADARIERMRSGKRASHQVGEDVSDLATLLNRLLDALATGSGGAHDPAQRDP
jgi:HPt (histidine-containing phosphotransfer) domain-containing protein